MLSAPFFPEELRGLASSLPPRAGGICFELTPPKAFRIGETALGCVFWVRPVVSPGVSGLRVLCRLCVPLLGSSVLGVYVCCCESVCELYLCLLGYIFCVWGSLCT